MFEEGFVFDVWNNAHFTGLPNGALALNVEIANALYFIVKKFYAIGVIFRKREDIYDTPTYRKLAWTCDKVYPFELVFKKRFV